MMRSTLHLLAMLLVGALIAIAAGCTSASVERRLQTAEALIDSYPDSALTILSAIDRSDLSGEHRARHALLLSQVYDKKFIDIADDSLISIAYNYYTYNTNADRRRRMMTYYYKGVVSYYGEDYYGAIHNLTIADSLASRINDWRYRGLANSLMAAAFNSVFDLKRNHDHSLRALDYFRLEGDSTHIRNQLYTVGLSFDQLKQYDSAMVYFNQAGHDMASWGIASSLMGLERLNDFKKHIDQYPEIASDPVIQSRYARLLIKKGLYDEAKDILQDAYHRLVTQNDSIQWLIPHAKLLQAKNDWHGYATDLETLLNDEITQNHLIKQSYSPASQSSANEFIALSDLRTSEQKRGRLLLWLLFAVFTTVSAILLGVIVIRARTNRFNRQMLRLAALNTRMRRNNDGLTREIEKVNAEKNVWQDRAIQLQEKLFQTEDTNNHTSSESDHEYILAAKQKLDTLYEQLLKIPSTDTGERRIRLKSEIDFYTQPVFTDRVDSFINRIHDNYITRAKAAHLPAKDLSLLRLLICGFSIPQIGVIMDISTAAISTRKSRLKDKIAKAGLPTPPAI